MEDLAAAPCADKVTLHCSAESARADLVLRLAKSRKDIAVRADQIPTDALLEAVIVIDVKCSDR